MPFIGSKTEQLCMMMSCLLYFYDYFQCFPLRCVTYWYLQFLFWCLWSKGQTNVKYICTNAEITCYNMVSLVYLESANITFRSYRDILFCNLIIKVPWFLLNKIKIKILLLLLVKDSCLMKYFSPQRIAWVYQNIQMYTLVLPLL